MIIYKTYKYRIYPNETQIILLSKHFGAMRFVWNHFLNLRKQSYLESKKSLTFYDNSKTLTLLKKEEQYIWLNEIGSQSLEASLQDLDTAYGMFFKKLSAFPQFKSKNKCVDSFRCRQFIKFKKNNLVIPKFKEGIKVNIHRKMIGKICFATITHTPTDKYFASITCEVEHMPLVSTGRQIGIDLGIKDLAVCSDGKIFENIKITKKFAKKLAYEQKQLAKKQKGSKKRQQQKKRVAKVYERIRNKRLDNLHKLTSSIISKNQTIIIEDLNVSGMIKNHKLAKSIADASWYGLCRQLEYKSKWNARDFVKIDRWFPSSKTCNNCNYINQNLTLKDREWVCPQCNATLDRDLNAAKNILKQGLMMLSGSGVESDIK